MRRPVSIAHITALTLAILLLVFGWLWYMHDSQLRQLHAAVHASELASRKLQLCLDIVESARARTRLIGQIIFVDDPFEKDRLNQELDGEAGIFSRARQALTELPLSDHEQKLLERQGNHASVVLPAQRQLTDLVMNDPENTKNEATRLLYEVIFPGQGMIIDEILDLASFQKSIIDESTAHATSIQHNYENIQRLIYAAVLLAVTMLSVLLVQRTARVERQLKHARDDAEEAYRQLQTHHQNLELLVTERTAELEKTKDEAVQANQAKSEFLSRMSHELRTPMNAILGFAQLLELDELSVNQRDGVSEILSAGNHLLSLINEILDLAKIEAGKTTLSREAIDLNELIDECTVLTKPLLAARGINISTETTVEAAHVWADRVRTKQVLLNLLSNAVKYNRDHGQIVVRLAPGNTGMIRTTVRDTGMGISEDKIPFLFDAFNRLGAENTQVEGAGIGLTISKKLVEAMAGNITVTSTVGVGSEFAVELPISDTVAAAALEPARKLSPDRSHTDLASTVLYVEDNPANLRLVKGILTARPHITLITAHDPLLGLEFAQHHQPHLILLDINLPGIDGFEVLRRLRDNNTTAHIPILAVSANVMPKDVARGKAAGFADYITKPINVPEFLATVDRFLVREG